MTKSQSKAREKAKTKIQPELTSSFTPVSVLLGTTIKAEQAQQVAIMQALLNSQPVAMLVQVIPGTRQVTITLLPSGDDVEKGFEIGKKMLQDALATWTEQGLLARQVREQLARNTQTGEEDSANADKTK